MKQRGFFWHVHHETLLEWCYNYNRRVECIRTKKPKKEIYIRLHLFKPVKNTLPQEVIEAWQVFNKAQLSCDKMGQELNRAGEALYKMGRALKKRQGRFPKKYPKSIIRQIKIASEAWQTYEITRQAYNETEQTLNKAKRAFFEALNRNRGVIEALHAKECPNCPWDGHTIFTYESIV